MRPQAQPIAWIEDLDEGSIPVAGSKIARLGALRRAGICVPSGFAVTVAAFERVCRETRLDEQVARLLAQVRGVDDAAGVETASAAIREAFSVSLIPDDLAEAVVDAYDELCYRCLDLNIPVAVRSSAVGEDSGENSFAGQFDTFLGMSGGELVLNALARCWASLFSARALTYRLRHGLSHHDLPMAVGVVKLVHARASGVAFSIHPVTGHRDRLVIEGSWGWGEAVVQGLVTPDHIEVGRTDRRVLCREVAHKAVVSQFDYARGAVVETEMPKRLRDAPILDAEELDAVVDAVLRIESHYGYPVDVEWVIDRNRRPGEPVTIVQARPETVHAGQASVPAWDPVAYASRYAFGNRR